MYCNIWLSDQRTAIELDCSSWLKFVCTEDATSHEFLLQSSSVYTKYKRTIGRKYTKMNFMSQTHTKPKCCTIICNVVIHHVTFPTRFQYQHTLGPGAGYTAYVGPGGRVCGIRWTQISTTSTISGIDGTKRASHIPSAPAIRRQKYRH